MQEIKCHPYAVNYVDIFDRVERCTIKAVSAKQAEEFVKSWQWCHHLTRPAEQLWDGYLDGLRYSNDATDPTRWGQPDWCHANFWNCKED